MNQIDYRGETPVACEHIQCPKCLKGRQLTLDARSTRPILHGAGGELYHRELCDGTDLQATYDRLIGERDDLQVELAQRPKVDR